MRWSIWSALLLLVLALAAGCGNPGGDDEDTAERADQEAAEQVEKPDVAAAGDVTLTIWDQEVRGGQAAQIKRLNQAFQEQYPNVTIERVARSFEDLNKTLKLAVSGPKAPDVVQANQGRPVMGTLVKGGLLKPLDPYAEAFGWEDRYSELLLDLNRFSSDGNEFGDGNLYGLSQVGEIVGVFYNKSKVQEQPATLEEFEQSLADAKTAGDIPIQFGNLDKWPGIHEYETVLGQTADKEQVRDFVFAREGASFDTPEFQEAAEKVQSWAEAGYFTPDFNGTGYDPAWQQFAKGEGRYLIAGTWLVADLGRADGRRRRLHADAGRRGGRRPGRARRRGPAVRDHVAVGEPRGGRRLHRLHHEPRGRDGAGRDGQPAGDAGRRVGDPGGAAGGGVRRVGAAERERRADPVPRLHDADVLRRHQRGDPAAAGRP